MIDPDLLQEVPMFRALPAGALDDLARIVKEDGVPAGRVLFDFGDPGLSMYIVKSGKVRISIPGDHGEEVPLATLGPGEFFGEMALLDGQPRSARATALDDTDLIEIARESFLTFVGGRPETALAMLAATAKRLRKTDELMRARASTDVNAEMEKTTTLADHISDKVASFGGSWRFVLTYIFLMIMWILVNTFAIAGLKPFDEPPYQGLNLVLGAIASLQAPFIMMSQNREQTRERVRTEADFKVNLKNEVGIERALERIEDLRRQLPELKRQMREQESLIRKIGERG